MFTRTNVTRDSLSFTQGECASLSSIARLYINMYTASRLRGDQGDVMICTEERGHRHMLTLEAPRWPTCRLDGQDSARNQAASRSGAPRTITHLLKIHVREATNRAPAPPHALHFSSAHRRHNHGRLAAPWRRDALQGQTHRCNHGQPTKVDAAQVSEQLHSHTCRSLPRCTHTRTHARTHTVHNRAHKLTKAQSAHRPRTHQRRVLPRGEVQRLREHIQAQCDEQVRGDVLIIPDNALLREQHEGRPRCRLERERRLSQEPPLSPQRVRERRAHEGRCGDVLHTNKAGYVVRNIRVPVEQPDIHDDDVTRPCCAGRRAHGIAFGNANRLRAPELWWSITGGPLLLAFAFTVVNGIYEYAGD